MFYNNYNLFITNMIRLGEKTMFKHINKYNLIDIFKIKQLEITFIIPSKIQYGHGFIAMLMLTEKMLNHKSIFLLDKKTLKKRTIKVGLIITIKNEIMNNYLQLCCLYSIPKFYNNSILFSISYKDQAFAYKISQILSNTIFSFDKDIISYYDYLGELQYDFDFLFRTYFKSISMNKLLIASKGIHFINYLDLTVFKLIEEAEEKALLLEEEEEEEEDDDEMNNDALEYYSEDDFDYNNNEINEKEFESYSNIKLNKEYLLDNIDISLQSYNNLQIKEETIIYLDKFKIKENMEKKIEENEEIEEYEQMKYDLDKIDYGR